MSFLFIQLLPQQKFLLDIARIIVMMNTPQFNPFDYTDKACLIFGGIQQQF